MRACSTCGAEFRPSRSGNIHCSPPCKWRAKGLAKGPDCSSCGTRMVAGPGVRMDGTAMCRDCRSVRRAGRRPGHRSECVDCGSACAGTRCLDCFNVARREGRDESRMRRVARRRTRDNTAPGPWKYYRRVALLNRWKRQGKVCVYCEESPVETVDHVIPLALGGTNYEGNLAPACVPCNALKCDHLLSAWRYGITGRLSESAARRWSA